MVNPVSPGPFINADDLGIHPGIDAEGELGMTAGRLILATFKGDRGGAVWRSCARR